MPINILSISQKEALYIVEAILDKASNDGGGPVAISVVDATARLIAFTAMDGVAQASIKLSQSKAYSAVVGQKDTVHWAQMPDKIRHFDMRNWTDENFTGFAGGITIKADGQIIGGIGISGRKGRRTDPDEIMQDTELARYGESLLFQTQEHATDNIT
jgi:glc operon protein GlcG